MKITDKTMKRMAQAILAEMNAQNVVTYKAKEDAILERAIRVIKEDYLREAELDKMVHAAMDEMERQNSGEPFQRYKMFPMLKKRMAKEKGIIL